MAYVLNNCTGNSKSGSWKKNQYTNATKNVVLETVRPVIKDKEMKQSREKQSKTPQKGGQLQHSSQFPGKHSTCWN